ncbi:hypothetical protein CY35_11G097200 [Sphagnum magellanicum]|nr:hypothetical protein CY35_11G097200 [Sphagnum magellanicum]
MGLRVCSHQGLVYLFTLSANLHPLGPPPPPSLFAPSRSSSSSSSVLFVCCAGPALSPLFFVVFVCCRCGAQRNSGNFVMQQVSDKCLEKIGISCNKKSLK